MEENNQAPPVPVIDNQNQVEPAIKPNKANQWLIIFGMVVILLLLAAGTYILVSRNTQGLPQNQQKIFISTPSPSIPSSTLANTATSTPLHVKQSCPVIIPVSITPFPTSEGAINSGPSLTLVPKQNWKMFTHNPLTLQYPPTWQIIDNTSTSSGQPSLNISLYPPGSRPGYPDPAIIILYEIPCYPTEFTSGVSEYITIDGITGVREVNSEPVMVTSSQILVPYKNGVLKFIDTDDRLYSELLDIVNTVRLSN